MLAVVVVLTVDYWCYPYGAPMPGQSANIGENGLWLRYTWYFGQQPPADVDKLAGRLQTNGLRYAYFHVRSIGHDGMLEFHKPASAKTLVAAVHKEAPATRVIAWIYAGNARGRGRVDLSSIDVRRNMVREAQWLVKDCGFDGVQWDYEICPDGDTSLLSLLTETRAALTAGKIVSVAAPVWMPAGIYGWSESYFGAVAKNCDQITVMCYDTAAYFPRTYVWLVHQQVVRVSSAVVATNPKCRVIIGIPTYGTGFRSHNPRSENVEMALRGVREGLADKQGEKAVIAGVSPFADYTTDEQEWRSYAAHWPPVSAETR